MAAKKKKTKRKAPTKRKAAKRPRKKAVKRRKGAGIVKRTKLGAALTIGAKKVGAGYQGIVTSKAGGALVGATGTTPGEAIQATRALLGGRKATGGSSHRERLASRRIRAFCGA